MSVSFTIRVNHILDLWYLKELNRGMQIID